MPAPSESRPKTEVSNLPSARSDAEETIASNHLPAANIPTRGFGPPTAAGEVGTMGPYRVVKELGRGGMGAVYAALDTRLERRLALKVMLPEFASNASARERFLREARAAARIKHDNVVTVYEADDRFGMPYITMEFLEGCPLDAYLTKKGTPTIGQVLRIAAETAAGLAAAHKIGLVHRDIKPGNLWLEAPNGRVKVLDFGLAKPVDAEVELTQSGAIVGTPAYMSPEQARGEKVDHRTDLFSLGAVMYRLCTNRLPFNGQTTMAVLMALGMEEPSSVRELNPDVPESLAALIHQLLSKRADARPQSAVEVVKRMREIAEELAVPRALPVEQSTSQPYIMQPQVVPAPIPVTAPAEKPFADLDESSTEMASREVSEQSSELAEPKPKPTRANPSGRKPWLIAGGALALVVLVVTGVIIVIKNKDGSETKIEVPDGSTVKIDKDGKTVVVTPPGDNPTDNNPDRKAAEYALSLGGVVWVNGEQREIKAAADLPKERFNLTYLNLHNTKVTDAGLENFKDCKGLRELDLNDTKVTDVGLTHFKDCKSLTNLHLGGTQVTDVGLSHFKDCKNLTHLTLSGTRVTDTGLAHFKDCKSLTGLGLGGTQVTDVGLANFKGCKELMGLDLYGTRVTDAGLAHFKDCKSLTKLYLRKTKVSAKSLEEFHAAVPGCRIEHDGGIIEAAAVDVDRKAAEYTLSVGGVVQINREGRDIKAAAELPKERFTLASVNLTGTKVSDAGLAILKDCQGLKYISLNNTQVTNAGLAHFKDCKKLTHLSLDGTQVSDLGLANFKDCNGLEVLYLGGTKVTETGLAHFKNCKGLMVLNLNGAKGVTDSGLANFKDCKKLEFLQLYNTQVTDDGLEHFKDCKNLTDICLAHTQVSDAGLSRLKSLKNLTSLKLRETKVTPKGLEEFHASVPGCKIEHDGGVIEPKK